MTKTEKALIESLQRLVVHELAAAHRAHKQDNCAELEAACYLLDELGMFPFAYRHLAKFDFPESTCASELHTKLENRKGASYVH